MTTRTLPSFEYMAPRTLREAIATYSKLGDTARILAGGTDLLVQMKFRETTPRYVLDISHIPGLRYVKSDRRGNLAIGALTTLRQLEDPVIQRSHPALHEAVQSFASVPVREMATVGGNLCNASPSADLGPPLLVAEAKLKIAGPAGTRTIAVDGIFRGPGKTALRRGEVLTEVQIPKLELGSGTRFIKMARSMQDLSKVSVAALVTVRKDMLTKARIALGAVAPTPMRARRAEKMLEGKKVDEKIFQEVGEMAANEAKPMTDVRSTAEYRRKVSAVLVKRAIITSVERARGRGS